MFYDHVSYEPNTGCWLWTAHTNANGYGTVKFGGRTQRAHRVAWLLENGCLPTGLVLDHLCRVRCCVNPKHLEAVTQRTNVLRGGSVKKRTRCSRGHELTPDNICIERKPCRLKRRCKTCKSARDRARYLRRSA